jgi:hypothetical protein
MQFLDQNNPLLGNGPARLDGGTITHPQMGKQGVLSVRTSSTTVTVIMTAESLRAWGKFCNDLADEVGGGTLQPASIMDVAALDTTMQRRTR